MMFISEEPRGPEGKHGVTVFVCSCVSRFTVAHDLNPIKAAVINAHPGSNCRCNCPDPTGLLSLLKNTTHPIWRCSTAAESHGVTTQSVTM